MFKLSNKKYKRDNNFKRLVTIPYKDIITVKRVRDKEFIFAYFNDASKNSFIVIPAQRGLIIKVTRKIQKSKVIDKFIEFCKKAGYENE